ncbi:Scn8a [Symbiodinium microadriaticum]|nr:Scn8a [Symbiodinium microadriaticum]
MGVRSSIGSPTTSPTLVRLGEESADAVKRQGLAVPLTELSSAEIGHSLQQTFTSDEDFADFRDLIGRLEDQYIHEMVLLSDENKLLRSEMAKVLGTGSTDTKKIAGIRGMEAGTTTCHGKEGSINPTFDMSAAADPKFRVGQEAQESRSAEGSRNPPSSGLPAHAEEPAGKSGADEQCAVVMGSAATTQMIAKIDAEVEAAVQKHDCASRLESDFYEITIGMLIIVNSVIMAIEFEYQGYVVGHDLDYRRMEGSPDEAWPHADSAFYAINLGFTIAFVVDIVLRLSFLRLRFFKLTFNWLDLLVVICSVTEILFQDLIPVDTVFMRLLRLGKVARAMRVVRHTEGMSSLIMLLKCVRASFNTLCWSLSFIVVLQCMAGMVMSQVLWPYMKDESADLDERREVFRYYGTFTGTFLTMFEVLLANWAPPARILVDYVSDWFVYVFVVYRCVVGFAVLNVVSAVFIQQTMKVAQADQELILKQRLRSEQAYAAKMREFFDKLDTDSTGFLTWQEFSEVLRKPELRSWMATLELETYDLVNLFHMIDDGDGAITVAEFLDGAIRLRGVAKSLDLAQVLSTTRRVDAKLEACLMAIQKLSGENDMESLKKTAFGKMSRLTTRRMSLHRRSAPVGHIGVESKTLKKEAAD